jgi:hypothetical protein
MPLKSPERWDVVITLVSLKLKRDKAKKKPGLTDTEIVLIQEGLKAEPEWMQVSFEIASHTGCRLRETQTPLSFLAFDETKITFLSPKSGEDKVFLIPMPTVLIPLLEKLKAERRSNTLDFPFKPSRRWQ